MARGSDPWLALRYAGIPAAFRREMRTSASISLPNARRTRSGALRVALS
jgi:hypothetical protein